MCTSSLLQVGKGSLKPVGFPCRVFFFPCSKACTLRRRVVLKQMDGRAVTVRKTREEDDVKGRRKKKKKKVLVILGHTHLQ